MKTINGFTRNGNTYDVVKVYNCGNEYRLSGKGGLIGFCYLVVGGGGGGRQGNYTVGTGGGGGGGTKCNRDFVETEGMDLCSLVVNVGEGGKAGQGGETSYICFGNLNISASGGCSGGNPNGGASGNGCAGGNGNSSCDCGGGGGGGAGGNGGNCSGRIGGNGGIGIEYCGIQFAGGGGGSGSCCCNCRGGYGCYGGGNGGCCSSTTGCSGQSGTGGGGGAGAAGGTGGRGGSGAVLISYPTDGSRGIKCAKGGECVFECGDYTVHYFKTSGLFLPNYGGKFIKYLGVGGGGGGCSATAETSKSGGGGGGAVVDGVFFPTSNSISITIGCGGNTDTDGGDTCIGGNVVAPGGKHGTYNGGASGSGCAGTGCKYGAGGGGGGAGGAGYNSGSGTGSDCKGGYGGKGRYGMGGGGGGIGRFVSGGGCGCGQDGGGNGKGNANYYGGGGGGGGTGYQGLVDVCYACDGSNGFSVATGGDECYLCGDICVHRFISDGVFCIVS